MVNIVKLLGCGCDAVPSQSDHSRVDVCFELVGLGFFDILADVLERELVSGLEFAEILAILLHCVVGQMNVLILQVFRVEHFGGCPAVAFFVPVGPQLAIDHCHQHVAANVELPLIVEKGHQVLLDDEPRQRLLHLLLQDEGPDIFHRILHIDPSAPVRVLGRLHNPELFLFLGLLVAFPEPVPLGVVDVFDVESQGDVLEWVDCLLLVVGFHVPEQGLLVSDFMVVDEVVVELDLLTGVESEHPFLGEGHFGPGIFFVILQRRLFFDGDLTLFKDEVHKVGIILFHALPIFVTEIEEFPNF